MDTQYFQATIRRINKITSYLNKYSAYVQNEITSIEAEPLPPDINLLPAVATPCGQLALLAVQVAEKIPYISNQVSILSAKVTADVDEMQDAIGFQLSALAPLLIAPTNLAEILTWIGSVIETFAGPNSKLEAQLIVIEAQEALILASLANLATAIANTTSTLTTAIQDAQSKLGCVE